MQMIPFLKQDCPHLWGLLNRRAKCDLPIGIQQFLSGPDTEEGASQLRLADGRVAGLIEKTSETMVGDKYRRQLSGVATENALAEFLCEVTLVGALGGISSGPPVLRPGTRKGKSCDVRVTVEGIDLFGEAKRLADSWKGGARSMEKSDKAATHRHVARPRTMVLASKLREEKPHEQLPQGTLNILFVFHPSSGVPTDPRPYIERALFAKGDGLYALREWREISACALSRIASNGALSIVQIWRHPEAHVPLPDNIAKRLALAH